MGADVLSHFGVLDELIQVIYQGFDRFVVLSTIAESSWTVHVSLKGPEGRWWRGSWSACEIIQFVGSKPSPELLEGFAHSLSGAFVNGELCVSNWAPEQGASPKINLTLRPTANKPVEIPLVELSAREAASHATMIFSEIALQAQSRQCRMNPPAFSMRAVATAEPSGSRVRTVSRPDAAAKKKAQATNASTAAPPEAEDETEATRRRIQTLEAELQHAKAAKAKAAKSKSPSSEVEPKPSASARRPKGASLANPHKKARKYEAVEFESDNDEGI